MRALREDEHPHTDTTETGWNQHVHSDYGIGAHKSGHRNPSEWGTGHSIKTYIFQDIYCMKAFGEWNGGE